MAVRRTKHSNRKMRGARGVIAAVGIGKEDLLVSRRKTGEGDSVSRLSLHGDCAEDRERSGVHASPHSFRR
jgi:hypothetical protein